MNTIATEIYNIKPNQTKLNNNTSESSFMSKIIHNWIRLPGLPKKKKNTRIWIVQINEYLFFCIHMAQILNEIYLHSKVIIGLSEIHLTKSLKFQLTILPIKQWTPQIILCYWKHKDMQVAHNSVMMSTTATLCCLGDNHVLKSLL